MASLTPPTTTPSMVLRDIDPLLIDPDLAQPRQEIDQGALDELAVSVREQGIVAPLRVIPRPDGRFQLLYGERRLRAAIASGLPMVPCIVEAAAPTWTGTLDIQLAENLHRAELRPLELAQTLWRRVLGANIEALEQEQGDDGTATAQLLADTPTPAGQIRALEARLAALAGVPTAAAYFASGRVRVGRKAVLGRYGIAGWSEPKLKKLFRTLDVAPAVQNMLAGVDVSGRALRELAAFDDDEQARIAREARADENGDVGAALREAIVRRGQVQPDDQTTGDDIALELPPSVESFVPDPQLALLTGSGGSAPRLITERPAPQRGSVPPSRAAGEWDDDNALVLEAALETVRTVARDMGVLRLSERQARRLAPLWAEVADELSRAGLV